MTQAPFFIVGCGRSGTTLLRRMLNHHPQIAIPVESLFIVDYLRAADALPLATLTALMRQEFELHNWDMNLADVDLHACPDVKTAIDRLHESYAQQQGKRYWGQKTPRFVRYGHLLKQHYPQGRFIHVIRDPRAVANSLRNSNVHRSNVYYGAQRWCKDVQHGRQLAADFPQAVLEIFYEELVTQPQAVLQRICAFLQMPYDEQMLAYHARSSAEYSTYHAQIHRRLTQKPTTSRIDAWQDELTPMAIQLIEDVTMPLMTTLGYESAGYNLTVPASYTRNLQLERIVRGIPRQVWQYTQGRTYHLGYSLWRKLRLGLLWKDITQVNY